MNRKPYYEAPNLWDRASRTAHDPASFDPISHGAELDRVASRWDRAMYLLAGVFAGLALSTQVFGA